MVQQFCFSVFFSTSLLAIVFGAISNASYLFHQFNDMPNNFTCIDYAKNLSFEEEHEDRIKCRMIIIELSIRMNHLDVT